MSDFRILVFIPMYNCAAQIVRVLEQLQDPQVAAKIDGVLCVDNRSTDDTAAVAQAGLENLSVGEKILLRNDDNYGLGGSHKVAIETARARGYTHLIVLHGDDQGAIKDILPHLTPEALENLDFLMGARFMSGASLQGYSTLRTLANKLFNLLFSGLSGQRLYDLGSGLNMFSLAAFEQPFHRAFADDLTFNYYLILGIVHHKFRLRFFPLSWREDDQVSNAKLSKMGVQLLRIVAQFAWNNSAFLTKDHRDTPRETYPSTEIYRG